MAGSVRVESILGQGTKFIITFKTSCQLESKSDMLQFRRQSIFGINFENSSLNHIQMVNQIMASQMRKNSVSSLAISKSSLSLKRNPLSDTRGKLEKQSDLDVTPEEKPWILIANDDIFLLQMIEGTLENDFQVEVAENGLQAFELVKKHGRAHFKAIVLDINMPIMDGIDACNKIHSYLSQECLISNMKIDPKRTSPEESKELKELN